MEQGQQVECGRHGRQEACFVCHHLLTGSGKGWVELDSGEGTRPDVWCAECDTEWVAQGEEWTQEFEDHAKIRVICGQCYDEQRARHQN